MNIMLKRTVGDKQWMTENHVKIAEIFPFQWTDAKDIPILKIGFDLKLLGVDWRSMSELINLMVVFEKMELVERNRDQAIRRHHKYLPEQYGSLAVN